MAPLTGITAAVLAGGLGTRLREAVADKPKVLAQVNGRPFLAYLLDTLAGAGVRRAILCTGYLADQVRTAFGTEFGGVELLYSQEESPLGTGGALSLALPLLDSSPVLVLNGDSFCDADLALFARQHLACGAAASLVLARVADVARYGAVETSGDGTITSFEEKGRRRGDGLINAGIYLLERFLIEGLPAGRALSLEKELFPGLIGHGLYGFAQGGKFIDIGIPADYYAAGAFFADRRGLRPSGGQT